MELHTKALKMFEEIGIEAYEQELNSRKDEESNELTDLEIEVFLIYCAAKDAENGIEDHELQQEALIEFLEQEGYTVSEKIGWHEREIQ